MQPFRSRSVTRSTLASIRLSRMVLQPCSLFILLSGSLLLLSSCHQAGNAAVSSSQTGLTDEVAAKTIGTYSGSFNKGIITLVINYISGKTVSGYDVHKGLRRNVNGSVASNGDKLDFILKEPGGNPFDGTFFVSLDTASLKMTGRWVPTDSTKTKSKQLALTRVTQQLTDDGPSDWTIKGGGDTTLVFKENGLCELAMYERADSTATSQLITIHGNYVQKADTFRIEWQKNSHTPAPVMRMIRYHTKDKSDDGYEYENVELRGNGWEFVVLMGD